MLPSSPLYIGEPISVKIYANANSPLERWMISFKFYKHIGKFQSIKLQEIWKNATLMNSKDHINENGNNFFI